MKILQYNWADYLSPEGGGVTIYLRNLFNSEAFSRHEVYMLSAGVAYTLKGNVHWRKAAFPLEPEGKRFEIVNSSVPAPAGASFGNAKELESPADTAVILNFLEQYGPFDIIHFHNLEGISLGSVRAIKEAYPETKMIFSVHNYYPLCPQVNLWRWRKNVRCTDFKNGELCSACALYSAPLFRGYRCMQNLIRQRPLLRGLSESPFALSAFTACKDAMKKLLAMRDSFKFTNPVQAEASSNAERLRDAPNAGSQAVNGHAPGSGQRNYYSVRREVYVNTINNVFDLVLCVSDRVRQICVTHGFNPEKTITDYIGTRHAQHFSPNKSGPIIPDQDKITLTYLGYARADKGFFFLLDALEQIPEELAQRITLQLGVRIHGNRTIKRLIDKKCANLKRVHLFDGYTHDDLKSMLADTSLGVVPVLWEDCLPQVAIEMHCYGVPLLCSNLGGAQELSNNPDFVFETDSTADFKNKLDNILNRQALYETYMKEARYPVDVEPHSKLLAERYHALLAR